MAAGDTVRFSNGRLYLVCSSAPYETVLRSDDEGFVSIVGTRKLIEYIADGKATLSPSK